MTFLYRKLNDSFDQHNGSLSGYTTSDGVTSADTMLHYDIRAFNSTDISIPWTQQDMRYWNAYHWAGQIQDTLSQPRSVVGASYKRRLQSDQDGALQSTLDTETQNLLDFVSVSKGNEQWDATATIAKDAAYRYSNSMRVSLTNGVTTTIASYYQDDIYTDFESGTWYIEMILRSFPAQIAAAHLDLTNSYIDFSSDQFFTDATQIDSISFSQSLNNLTGGGDVTFRINRNQLTHVNLTAITAIRLRLKSVGNMTFIAQAMRLVPSNYNYPSPQVGTKRGVLTRTLSVNGSNEPTFTESPRLFVETRPLNSQYTVKFNSGHHPTGADNTFRVYLRWVDANNFVAVRLSSRDIQSQITITERINGVNNIRYLSAPNSNILAPETDYYLRIDLTDTQITASIYATYGVFLGSLIYTSGSITLSILQRGRSGFSFEPYYYDFNIDLIDATKAEFGSFESTLFESISPVAGVTLNTSTSKAIDVLEGSLPQPSGDATITSQPDPSSDLIQVVRDGTNWFGGISLLIPTVLGTSRYLSIDGDIYPLTRVRGHYRVALVNQNNSVGFMADITNLLPNQWNHFSIPVVPDIIPSNYTLYLQQVGFYPDTFQVDNLHINHETVTWYASADAGTNWQPFLSAIDQTYSGIYFNSRGSELKVRATALSDQAWIQGYELIPHYMYPESGSGKLIRELSIDTRVIGAIVSLYSADTRVTGGTTSNTTRDTRVTGGTSTNRTSDTRVTGGTATNTTRDTRVSGGTNAFRAQDLRITGA